MTGRTRAARQSRPEGQLEGERKKVSGLKSRRGHAVCPLSSLRRGRRQPTGTWKEGSNGFPAAVVPVANSGVVMVGEGPFSFLALAVVDRLPTALISVGAWRTVARHLSPAASVGWLAPELLAGIDLAGQAVTFDALHTVRANLDWLVTNKNAHYIAIVKKNQPLLYARLTALPWRHVPTGATSRDTGHGRTGSSDT
jgi:hypothetical protein